MLYRLIPLLFSGIACAAESAAALKGAVRDAVSGAGVDSAIVTLQAQTGGSPPIAAIATPAGAYRFDALPPGAYNISTRHPSYLEDWRTRVVTLAAGATASADLTLTPPGSFRGSVSDEDRKPVAGASVFAFHWSDATGFRRLVLDGAAQTAPNGDWAIGKLPPGVYLIAVKPLPGVAVTRPEDPLGEFRYCAAFYPNAPDPASAVAINVAPGGEAAGIDMRLTRTRTVAIRGAVDRYPATVTLAPESASGAESLLARFAKVTPASDGGAHFEIQGVAAGSYLLFADNPSEDTRRSGRLPLQVGVTAVTGLRVPMQPWFDVAGSVSVEDGEAPEALMVTLTPEVQGMLASIPMDTVKDGSFTLRGVAAEPYRWRISGLRGDLYVKDIRIGSDPPLASNRLIAAPGMTVHIVLSGRGASLQGKCPAPDAPVTLASPDDRGPRRQATCDDRGEFRIGGIAPGSYEIFSEPGRKHAVRLEASERKAIDLSEHDRR